MKPAEYLTMRVVEDSHWWYRGLRSMLRQALGDLTSNHGIVILDAGCGTGANLRLLQSLAPSATLLGLDYSADALSVPQAHVLYCRGDGNQLPLADNSVDLILASDLLGQAGVRVSPALHQLYRVLKPGGRLILNVPAFPCLAGEHDRAVHVDKRFRKDNLRQHLHAIGLEIVSLSYWNFLIFLPMLVHRFITRLHNRDLSVAKSDLTLQRGFINDILSQWMKIETRLAMLVPLPFGSSLLAIVRKPNNG